MLNKGEPKEELLRTKPERGTTLRPAPFLLLIGGVIILSTLFVVVWQVASTSNGSSNANTGNSPGKQQSTTTDDRAPWDRYPSAYWQTLRAQIAQGLHLSEQQIKDKMQTAFPKEGSDKEIGKAIVKWWNDLATTQGLTQQQFQTLKKTAIQQAHAELVRQQVLTQQKSDENSALLLALDQNSLNIHITDAFEYCQDKNGFCRS
jgi:hypothetical protein